MGFLYSHRLLDRCSMFVGYAQHLLFAWRLTHSNALQNICSWWRYLFNNNQHLAKLYILYLGKCILRCPHSTHFGRLPSRPNMFIYLSPAIYSMPCHACPTLQFIQFSNKHQLYRTPNVPSFILRIHCVGQCSHSICYTTRFRNFCLKSVKR